MSTPADSSPDPEPKAPPPHGAPPTDDPNPRTPHPSTLSSRDERNLGTLAHLLALFTFFVGPLALFLMHRGRSPYVEGQALEALNFQILVAICLFISSVLVIAFIGVLLVPATLLAHAGMTLYATIQASEGVSFRYPVSLRLIK